MTIGIEHVKDYPLIRFEIRFERKFPIRRSLLQLWSGDSMTRLVRAISDLI